MKTIVAHRSWNLDEILQMLQKTGNFTACNLPHYRFRPVQERCAQLQRQGFITCYKKNFLNRHYRITPKFEKWGVAFFFGETKLGPVRWYKEGWDLV